ncbi:UbiD family decarboxylase [Pseudonocardia sp. MH-G8]|uniref:UbiD family decarboxylase n=1 Tax=Pseudonocardia sp. MH-G8 TaxID=1854588 RepID=UPI000B9FBF88|nr:UbiD family decarboxylase [Pseudonocardia sp. MH-G8]OZM77070.1 benzoate transporter [Pseudonocardia sp. MH-G8]
MTNTSPDTATSLANGAGSSNGTPTTADLRSALADLRSHGELSAVSSEVHWNRELGAVSRVALQRNSPGLLFENITDYNHESSRCGKVTTNLLASHRRIAILLGLDPETPYTSLVEHVREHNEKRIEPVRVDAGPVRDNIVRGADVDLHDLPVPHWHYLDGGRYINTFAAVVTRDPDDGTVNLGVYRGMIVGRNKIATLMVPSQGWGRHWAKWIERGEPMPVACVYGWHPVMDILAGSPIPQGVSEYDVMGGFLGAPVPLVQCETVDLQVPATAEIVVEGHVSPDPDTYEWEGPFGEFTGYVSDVPKLRPTIEASCVTHRDDPIFRGTLEGSLPGSPGENSYLSSVQRAGIAWATLENARVPGIRQVYVHPVTNGTTIVVQIDKVHEGHAKMVAAALWSSNAALYRYKYVIVVDEDVDPSDYSALDWAIAYRVQPGSDDVVTFPGSFGSPIDPSTPLEDRDVGRLGAGLWNRTLIDATRTFRYAPQEAWGGRTFPPTVLPAKDDLDLVHRRWADYAIDR